MANSNNDTKEQTSAHSTASVDDVHDVIATDLEDSEIIAKLEDSWFEAAQANDLDAMTDIAVRQLEKYYAAYLIRAFRDRGIEKGSEDSMSITYDGSALDELRRKVRERDPSGELIEQEGVTRKSAGNFGTARPHSNDGIGDRGAHE